MFTPLDIFSMETWILLISIVVLLRIYINKRWSVLSNLNVPHDPPSILGFGNMGRYWKNFDEFLYADFELKKKYGKLYGMYMGFSPRITIWDPEILKQIFIKEYANFPDRQKAFTKVNGKEMNTALLNVSGPQWKRVRHTLSPLFSASKLRGMMSIMDVCSEKLIERMMKEVKENEGRFKVKEIYGNYSMDVVCSAAFRVDVNTKEDGERKDVEMAQKLINNTFFRSPWFWIIMIFPWVEKYAPRLNVSAFDDKVVGFFRRLVEFASSQGTHLDVKSKEVDFMKIMLAAEVSDDQAKDNLIKGLTRNEIVGNAMIMIVASYENVANTLMYLSYCIAMHDGVQEKLYQELMESIEREGQLTYDGVTGMRYLDWCLKETLRFYTTNPRNSRYCEKDIKIGDLFIPAGMNVDVPVLGLSHDEEYWDQPWEFKPERFEDMSKIDPMVYQPFGAGPRNCIGMRFALFEVKMAMCKLLEKFEFSACEDTPKPPLELTIQGGVRPKKELFLRVTPRQYSNEQTAAT